MAELEEALADFTACRSARIADAIEVLGRAAAGSFALPKMTKNIDYHRAWIEGVADPRTRSWFLDRVLDKLPKLLDGKEHFSGDKSAAVAERFMALAKLPCDPRIGRAVLATAALRSPVCGFEDASLAMVEALVPHADDEAAGSSALPEIAWSDDDGVAKLVERLPAAAKGKQIAKWAKHAAPTKSKLDVAALEAAVYADPQSDGPREVLADALQSAGDPRGELIALQLREARGEASDELVARATELCKEHGKEWLGSLRAVTYRADLRRGFLSRLEMAGAWATKDWKKVFADPAIRTIERLESGQATGKVYGQMLAAVAPTVEDIEVFEDALMDLVENTPMPRLRAIRVMQWKRKPIAERFAKRVLPWIEAHGQITTIGCADAKQVASFSDALGKRVEHLIIRDDLGAAAAALWSSKRFPKLKTLRLEWLSAMELSREGRDEIVRVYPDKFGFAKSIELKRLPKTVKRVLVIGNATAAAELKKKYPKLAIEAARPPSGYVTGVK